jgi:hypothetical protein
MDAQALVEIETFFAEATKALYGGKLRHQKQPQRPGFIEYVYARDVWEYRNSFAGTSRLRGVEVVSKEKKPVFSIEHGAAMLTADKEMVRKIVSFLKQVLAVENKGFVSFRGPAGLSLGSMSYKYRQDGNTVRFNGYEEIYYKDEKMYLREIMGGIIEK